MDKASKRALERFPVKKRPSWSSWKGWSDGNLNNRKIYREAYRQAEKDLALTAEDMNKIDHIIQAVLNDTQHFTYRDWRDFHEEVLQRFNEYKSTI